MLQAIGNDYTQISSIRQAAAASPAVQSDKALQSAKTPQLGKISESTRNKALLYEPAQQSVSVNETGSLTTMRLWAKAVANTVAKKGSPEQAQTSQKSSSPNHGAQPLAIFKLWPKAAANVASGNTTYDKGAGAVTEPKDNASSKSEAYTGCETCAHRVYQDDSDDSGVSFQTPKGLPSSTAGLFVNSHEGEHATRETARAQENGEIITNKTVTLQMGICPECHKMYVKGGTTSITKMPAKKEGQAVVQKAADLLGETGENLDMAV